MISDLDIPIAGSTHNGQSRAVAHGDKTPERCGWELLAWAILEQAVDDLVVYCTWGIVTEKGKCLPWPTKIKRRTKQKPNGPQHFWQRVPHTIASSHGPNDHRQLVAWFKSSDAQTFCNLIGCRLPADEIFTSTIKNHGGLK